MIKIIFNSIRWVSRVAEFTVGSWQHIWTPSKTSKICTWIMNYAKLALTSARVDDTWYSERKQLSLCILQYCIIEQQMITPFQQKRVVDFLFCCKKDNTQLVFHFSAFQATIKYLCRVALDIAITKLFSDSSAT